MTLVSALSGCEGVVLFADTQETVSDYTKKVIDKVEVWDFPNRPFRFAIAGACQDAIYADMLQNQISSALLSINNFDLKVIIDTLADTLTEFYGKHVWPRGGDKHQMQYLVPIQPLPSGAPEILYISETAVNVVGVTTHTKSIGVGSYLADYLYELLLGGGETIPHLCAASVFVAREACRNVDGVGDLDRVVILGIDGRYDELSPVDIKEIERNLEGLNEGMRHFFSIASDLSQYHDNEELKNCVIEIAQEARQGQQQWLKDFSNSAKSRASYINTVNSRFIKRIS